MKRWIVLVYIVTAIAPERPRYIVRVLSYRKYLKKLTISKSEAHGYMSESNARKAADYFGGVVELVVSS